MKKESQIEESFFPILLFLVFLVLKLSHVIEWSWWWVTAPIWLPLDLAALVIGVCSLFIFVYERGNR